MPSRLISFAFLILEALQQSPVATAQQRPFTARDSVEMAYFGNLGGAPASIYDDGAVSPDGRYAIKLTHRSVFPEGVTEGTIWLFDVSDVKRSIDDDRQTPAPPMVLARLTAAINGYTADWQNAGNVVLHPRWSDDSDRVYFLGRDRQENRQLFRVEVTDSEVTALSPQNRDVFAYSIAGDRAVFLAGKNVDPDDLWRSAGEGIEDISIGTGTSLLPLLFPNFLGEVASQIHELEVWQVTGETAEALIDAASDENLRIFSSFAGADISISPDGQRAVTKIVDSQSTTPGDNNFRWLNLESGSFQDTADLSLAEPEWIPFTERPRSSPIRFEVSESLNDPPVLVATDTTNGKSRVVFDPNPQLEEIALLPVSVFEWEDQHGRTNIGGLIKPNNAQVGSPFPLVIQTHGFAESRFFRVGYADTANSGRALASRGIVVLQVQEAEPNINDPPIRISEVGLDVYLSAIDVLAEQRLIDPTRVGISGYSFSGITVANSITIAPERFAAAAIANADPLTMTGYFSYVDGPNQGSTERYFVGTGPFGDGMQRWIDISPSMSTHTIAAPVLISAADPWHLLSLWDFYAALRYQKLPVELQYIRSGKHNITKPLHRLAHQEMLVDWFDFWLNGHEVPDPAKANQYGRWREMEYMAK